MEYHNNDSGCYATLQGYNARQQGFINSPAMMTPTPAQNVQVLPVWGASGYDVLTHGQKDRCGGYFTIEGAYPSYASNCGKYMKRACAGTLKN